MLSYQTGGNDVFAPSFTVPKIRTLIVFVKQDSTDRYLGVRLSNGSAEGEYNNNTVTIKIDCSDGTLANNPTSYTISYSSQLVGNGWYKICINRADEWNKFLFQSSTTLNTMDHSLTGGVLIWGVQVIDGTVDINTPVYNREIGYSIPRLDYSGSSCPEYLVETVGTNTLVRSEDFTQATWVKTNISASASTFLSPTNNSYANILTATGSNGIIRQSGTTNATTRQRIFSVYLQRKTGTGPVTLSMGSVTGSVNLSTGSWTRGFVVDPTLSGTYSASVGNYTVTTSTNHGYSTGDAIYFDRITGTGADASISSITVTGNTTFTFTNGSITSNGTCTIYSNTGKILIDTLGDEVYAWGAQVEIALQNTTAAGLRPSSFIPTTTAQISRTSDDTVFNISGSISSSFYIELSKAGGAGAGNPYLFLGNETSFGTSTDGIGLSGGENGIVIYEKKENNGAVTNVANPLQYAPPENTTSKILITTSGSILNLWMDGSFVRGTTFANPSRLRYITLQGNLGAMRLRKVASWPTTLTRSEIDLLFSYPYYNAGYAPVNYELQATINRAFFEGFTIPSTTILAHCDTLITNLKSSGYWDLCDVFYNFAYNNSNLSNFSRINWKNANGVFGLATFNGGISYNVNGVTGDGITGFIDTNYNPSLIGIKYQLNSAHMIAMLYSNTGNNPITGVAGTNVNLIYSSTGAKRINNSNSVNNTALDFTGVGMMGLSRDSSTTVTSFLRNTSAINNPSNSGAIQNSSQLLLRERTVYSTNGISLFTMGESVTFIQFTSLRTHYNTFLTSLGLSAIA